jgi:hypothetical protein
VAAGSVLSSIVFVSLIAFAGVAAAQAGSAPEPRPGQLGKDVIWVATSGALAERMMEVARVGPADFVIDLGSGDGVLVIAAAKRGARALGIEYDARLVDVSRERAANAGVAGRAQFVQADFFQADLSGASVVTMYLTQSLNLRLRPRLLALKPGTRVVSNTFGLGEWKPDETANVISFRSLLAPVVHALKSLIPGLPFERPSDHCFLKCTAYLWIVPAEVGGRWQSPEGELLLAQSFQVVSGVLQAGAGPKPIAEGRLRGAEFAFRIGEASYSARVHAGRMDGVVKRLGTANPWTALRLPERAGAGR